MRLDISCEFSANLKCQDLFSLKNDNKKCIVLSADILPVTLHAYIILTPLNPTFI